MVGKKRKGLEVTQPQPKKQKEVVHLFESKSQSSERQSIRPPPTPRTPSVGGSSLGLAGSESPARPTVHFPSLRNASLAEKGIMAKGLIEWCPLEELHQLDNIDEA